MRPMTHMGGGVMPSDIQEDGLVVVRGAGWRKLGHKMGDLVGVEVVQSGHRYPAVPHGDAWVLSCHARAWLGVSGSPLIMPNPRLEVPRIAWGPPRAGGGPPFKVNGARVSLEE